jgi:K319-like protein
MKLNLILVNFLFITVIVAFASCKKENNTCCFENEKWPVANAGKDTILVLPVNRKLLDGSASYDPDGSIDQYKWSLIGRWFGSPLPSIVNNSAKQTEVVNLGSDIFRFELKVTDNKGYYSSDTVTVQVEASVFSPHPVGFWPFQSFGFSWDTTAMGLMVAGPVPGFKFSDFPEDNNGSKWMVELVQQSTNTNIILPYVKYNLIATTYETIFYSIKDLVSFSPGENPIGHIYIFAKPNQTAYIDFTKEFDINLFLKLIN